MNENQTDSLDFQDVLPQRITGIVVGTFLGQAETGALLVDFPGNGLGPLHARGVAELGSGDVGAEVALMFEAGDPRLPIVMGRIQHFGSAEPAQTQVQIEDGRLVLSAAEEIELRCGKARLTLTRAGKILLRGAYLLSRATGTNRIQGGSVQLN